MNIVRLFIVCCSAGLIGCLLFSCTKLASDFDENSTVSDMLLRGDEDKKKEDFARAAKIYLKIDEYFPYSDDARKALVKAIQSYHAGAKFHELRSISKKFLQLYPKDKNAPFAKYMVGISYFEQIIDVERDQGATRDSIREFSDLLILYPNSKYTKLAKENIVIAKNQLAGQEMAVGRYYLKRGNPIAALKRFQSVLTEHQQTPFYQESLYRTIEAYLMIGIDGQGMSTYRVLKKKFPDSKWTSLAYDQLKESSLEDS